MLKMRLFIKWRFYFILFEVVTVSNQIGPIGASRYPGTSSRDRLRPPTHFPPRHLKGPWALTKGWRPLSSVSGLSGGEGRCVQMALLKEHFSLALPADLATDN